MKDVIKGQLPLWRMMRNCAMVIMLPLYLSSCNEKKSETAHTNSQPEQGSAIDGNSTVNEYIEFVNSDNNRMDLDHAFTNEALRKLVDATNAMADEIDYDVKADMEKVNQYAEEITKDPFETTHADNIRNAAVVLTTALQNMQKEKFPNLNNEAEDVKKACESIKPDKLTLDQKDAVKSFFREAADLLEKMG